CGVFFFFSSRRRHTRFKCDWSSDVCSSDLHHGVGPVARGDPRLSTGDDNSGRDGPWRVESWHDSSPLVVLDLLTSRALGERGTRSEERRVGKERRVGWWGVAESIKNREHRY